VPILIYRDFMQTSFMDSPLRNVEDQKRICASHQTIFLDSNRKMRQKTWQDRLCVSLGRLCLVCCKASAPPWIVVVAVADIRPSQKKDESPLGPLRFHVYWSITWAGRFTKQSKKHFL